MAVMEYAILVKGEIATVLTSDRGRANAEHIARELEGPDATVVPLHELPEDVKRRYFYDEDPQYQDMGLVGSFQLWECLTCSAVIRSKANHSAWHCDSDG